MLRRRHISQDMRTERLGNLTHLWAETLDARLALCESSPAAALDRLLLARALAKRVATLPEE